MSKEDDGPKQEKNILMLLTYGEI